MSLSLSTILKACHNLHSYYTPHEQWCHANKKGNHCLEDTMCPSLQGLPV